MSFYEISPSQEIHISVLQKLYSFVNVVIKITHIKLVYSMCVEVY